MRNRIRLNESDLNRVVKESVRRVLNEDIDTAWSELAAAKRSGDVRRVLDALHNLEDELRKGGKLSYSGKVDGGTWQSTRDLSGLDPRFTR